MSRDPIQLEARPVIDHDGSVVGWACTVADARDLYAVYGRMRPHVPKIGRGYSGEGMTGRVTAYVVEP